MYARLNLGKPRPPLRVGRKTKPSPLRGGISLTKYENQRGSSLELKLRATPGSPQKRSIVYHSSTMSKSLLSTASLTGGGNALAADKP